MRVLEDGKHGSPEEWVTTVNCTEEEVVQHPDDRKEREEGCGAKLEVELNDLIVLWWHGTHFRHDYAGVRCPQCGALIKVTVPTPVWQMLRERLNEGQAEEVFDGFSESIF